MFFTEWRALTQQAAVGEDDSTDQESLHDSDNNSLYYNDNNNNDGLQTKSDNVGDELEIDSINVVISGA